MNLTEAQAIVSQTIQAHTRIVRLLSEPTYDHAQEKRDQASETWDAQDYKDATEGGCGFPWEKHEDEDEDDWNDTISRDAHFHIAQIAFGMVEALAGSWRDTSASEFAGFLNECGLNGEWVAGYIPQNATPEDVLSYY
jgi:hypothetical protein